MPRRTFVPILVSLLFASSAAAQVGIPDLNPSFATIENSGGIFITPAGNGPSLGSRGLTITVHVLDANEDPIAGFPFQDLMLSGADGLELNVCPGGGAADANTNVDGITTISGSIAGGGFTRAGVQVYLSGVPLAGDPLPVDVNSPDISGDRRVDLADVTAFSGHFGAQTDIFAADFNHDGALDLADVTVLATHLGEECP